MFQATPDLLKGQQELTQQTNEETAKQILYNYLKEGLVIFLQGALYCPLWWASYFPLLRPCVSCFLPALCEPFQGSGSVAGVFITAFETWVEEGEEGEGNVGNDIIL